MKAFIKLLFIAILTTWVSGCYGKYIHENAQDRQKDAGTQNFAPAVVTPESNLLQVVSCTQQIDTLGTSIRNALHTHGEPNTKASTQLKCYQHQTTNEPILQIKSKVSGEWIWLTRN